MSNKVYLVQKQSAPVVGRIHYPTRQSVIPHVVTHAPVVRVIQNTPPQKIQEDIIESDILDYDRPTQKPQRRRERLTHLTQEQKMDRRKMKNREAAQNARDRKKVQTHQMEQKLKQMATEIRQLRAENAKLRAQLNKQQQTYIPSEYESHADTYASSTHTTSECSSSPSIVEPAEESSYDEFFVETPTFPSECVEIYSAPNEVFHQTNEVSAYQKEFVVEENTWTSNQPSPGAYAPSAPIQHQLGTQLPAHIMHDQTGEYYKQLAQSEFVDEIGREPCELPMWNDDPCFAKAVTDEGAAIAQDQVQEQEIIPADIDDLYDYIWASGQEPF